MDHLLLASLAQCVKLMNQDENYTKLMLAAMKEEIDYTFKDDVVNKILASVIDSPCKIKPLKEALQINRDLEALSKIQCQTRLVSA